MRIISGKYKGRTIEGYNILGTRPTMDRVKESLFGSIQTSIKGSICLDLFAGSGSLGLEALSNGASACYFVDHNKIAIDTLKKNCQKLKIEEETIFLNQEFGQALQSFRKKQFDIIFLDPPYNNKYIGESLKIIEELELLNDNGIIVCEYETEKFISQYTCIKEKKYGSTYIRIYKNLTNE